MLNEFGLFTEGKLRIKQANAEWSLVYESAGKEIEKNNETEWNEDWMVIRLEEWYWHANNQIIM